MSWELWLGVAGVFAGSTVLAWLLTPVALRLAVERGVLDRPGGHKGHDGAVPYLGGLAMVLSFAGATLGGALLLPIGGGVAELGIVLGTGAVLALVGLADDLRGLPVWLRLAMQAAAGVVLHLADIGVLLFGGGVADGLITVLWVVGVTNALNLLDNMDGLSSGIASITAAGISIIAAINGQVLVAALAAGLSGCALGFLRHNRHPATIYMGDAGSLFLGYVLAALAVKLRFEAPADVTFLVPIILLGVPLFDTVLVVAARLSHGRSPLQGGRDHTSHRLAALGLPVPVAVGVIYVVGAALAWIALVVSRSDSVSAYLLFGLLAALAAGAATLLWRVPVYSNSRTPEHLLRYVPEQPAGDDPSRDGAPHGSVGAEQPPATRQTQRPVEGED